VTNLPNGIRTVTESDDPQIAQLIKEHVASMAERVDARSDPGLPIESPALHAILRNGDKVQTTVETTANGSIVVQTSSDPETVAALCEAYRTISDEERIPSLLAVATFVFDFLCVHPFRDGNGRASRLITTLLLKEHGFEVVRYVGLERLVEERKEEYYSVLEACSNGWHEGSNEIVPWWNFFLAVLRSGYREFESQLESTSARPAKSGLVRRAVMEQVGRFTLADIVLRSPGASPQLIKKVLSGLKREGKVRLSGKGRGAEWEVFK